MARLLVPLWLVRLGLHCDEFALANYVRRFDLEYRDRFGQLALRLSQALPQIRLRRSATGEQRFVDDFGRLVAVEVAA